MDKFIFKKEGSLTQNEFQELEKLLVPLFSFSYHFSQSYKQHHQLYYSSKPIWQMLVWDNNQLVGSLSIVKRVIDQPMKLIIGGIGNLGVKQEFQNKGLATKMLNKTNQFLEKNNFNFSLLFCVERLKEIYINAGYVQIDKPVTFINDKGEIENEEVALFFPISLDQKSISLIKSKGLFIGQGSW